MTDREIAEETLMWLRTVGDVVRQMNNGGGMAAMMGQMLKGMTGRKG